MIENRPETARKLDRELVGWLTTVTGDGRPQSSIVWFLRDGNDLLIYSQPTAHKLDNIEANPNVAFNLRSDKHGDHLVTMEATASIDRNPTPADQVPDYIAKYGDEIKRLGWTPAQFAEGYPTLIRLRVGRVRVS